MITNVRASKAVKAYGDGTIYNPAVPLAGLSPEQQTILYAAAGVTVGIIALYYIIRWRKRRKRG